MSEPNGWSEWSKYVLKELEDNDKDHKEILAGLKKIEIDLATLKAKAGVWGALAGFIISSAVSFLGYVFFK